MVTNTAMRKHGGDERKPCDDQLEAFVLERKKQLEAVIVELENEIIERRQAEMFLQQRQSEARVSFNELVQSLAGLQASLRNMVYAPADEVKFKLGDLHVLVGEILEKLKKSQLNPLL